MKGYKKDLIIVNIVFFLYKFGESMLDTTTRPYILTAVCNQRYDLNETLCGNTDQYPDIENDLQQEAAFYLIGYRILVNVPAVILGLFCGAFSDKFGRKIPMLFPSFGSISGVLLYIGSLFYTRVQLPLILAGASVQGISGKSTIITMAANSYISDVTEKDQRIRQLGTLLAVNFFGMFMGSFLSGLLQDVSNFLITYGVVVFLHASAILLTAACLKESIDIPEKTDGGKSKIMSLFSPSNVKESIQVLTKERPNKGRRIVLILFLLTLINQICKVGDQDVSILFVTRSPLSWPKSWYGYLLSLDSGVMGLSLLLIIPLLSTYLKLNDATILVLGLCCRIVRLSWIAFATMTWMVFLSVFIGAVYGIFTSAVRSLLSKSVSEGDAGKLFSLLACTETTSKILGVLLFVNIYSLTADFFAGTAYLCEATLFFFMLIIVMFIIKNLRNIGKHEIVIDVEKECLDVKNETSYDALTDSLYPGAASLMNNNSP